MGKSGSSASKIVRGASEDRISDLPKNVIDMIFDALTIRDAVRTSLLSRQWQYRWVTISKLIFDDQFFSSSGIENLNELEVRDIINKILLLHIGPIPKFSLLIKSDFSGLEENISPWLHFLSTNGIKELTLCFPSKVGSQLFSCLELTHLIIVQCELNPPSAFEGFPHLTTLELVSVDTNVRFGDIISACPLLERVSIEDCYGIHNLVVSSPNLEYFHVKGAQDLKTICLTYSKSVATLSISLSDESHGQKIVKLYLGDNILEFSGAASSLPKTLPTSLENLKKLVLSYVDFNDVVQILCILCMIQSSSKLSELEIWGQCSGDTGEQDLNFVEDFDEHNCIFGQLQIVKLKFLQDLETEIALIKLLLARSPLLENMSIHLASGNNKNKAFSMCKKLMQLGRASPKAALIYTDAIDH